MRLCLRSGAILEVIVSRMQHQIAAHTAKAPSTPQCFENTSHPIFVRATVQRPHPGGHRVPHAVHRGAHRTGCAFRGALDGCRKCAGPGGLAGHRLQGDSVGCSVSVPITRLRCVCMSSLRSRREFKYWDCMIAACKASAEAMPHYWPNFEDLPHCCRACLTSSPACGRCRWRRTFR